MLFAEPKPKIYKNSTQIFMNGIPLINGQVYSWADVVVTIGGVPITGIVSVEYGEDQEVNNVYGAGRYPIGRAKGRITPSGKIELLQETVEDIQRLAPKGRLQDLPVFNVGVTYLNTQGNIVHDNLKNCSFKDNKRAWKEGETGKTCELELIPSHIDWGAQLV